ncbi:hypothetical protein PANDA_001272 [Ailuropoda melanoleuca]|uniref:Staphylococcal nuclease domain-containing protein 1 n=1 Tax=Ailuropoda melanoleuca TaxID=9646 RepID=D2GWR3_AILME|nr:hypothetical protein PANDA_001272 [Ailuropoda melanoleuca]
MTDQQGEGEMAVKRATNRLSQCDPAGPKESPHLIIPLLTPFSRQPTPRAFALTPRKASLVFPPRNGHAEDTPSRLLSRVCAASFAAASSEGGIAILAPDRTVFQAGDADEACAVGEAMMMSSQGWAHAEQPTESNCNESQKVEVEVESMDKAGNFIGWLHIDSANLSVLLVEHALSKVHFTAERSSYYKSLLSAEEAAKQKKEKGPGTPACIFLYLYFLSPGLEGRLCSLRFKTPEGPRRRQRRESGLRWRDGCRAGVTLGITLYRMTDLSERAQVIISLVPRDDAPPSAQSLQREPEGTESVCAVTVLPGRGLWVFLVVIPWVQDKERRPGNSRKQALCQGSEQREGWGGCGEVACVRQVLLVWAHYEEQPVEEVAPVLEEKERSASYKPVFVTEITDDLHFYVQDVETGTQLEKLMENMRNDIASHPPVEGSYAPRRGEFCIAKFVDGEWYRARVEKVESPAKVHVFYIDYGNREILPSTRLGTLPPAFSTRVLPAQATEYAFAFIQVPQDEDARTDAVDSVVRDIQNTQCLLNVEHLSAGCPHVTLQFADSKGDVGLGLVKEGLVMVEVRKEKQFQKVITEYLNAQESAKSARLNLWRYGDFRADDADEFGYSR